MVSGYAVHLCKDRPTVDSAAGLLWQDSRHITKISHFKDSVNNPTPMKIIPKFLMTILMMKVVNTVNLRKDDTSSKPVKGC